MKRRIAINTGGGDAPGLNAVIRAATLSAIELGFEVWGIRHGYDGLFSGDVIELTLDRVRGITHVGGTILGAANRTLPSDRAAPVVAAFRERGFEGLIAIGGDGSMRLARALVEAGLPPVMGVPKTIDNDVAGTDVTFGFDTAVAIATEALDRLHTTAEAHDRVMVVEVMGRTAGWIAATAGIAGSADAILIPEIPFDLGAVVEKIERREALGRRFSIVVVAEGAASAEAIAEELAKRTKKDTRSLVLGHLLRGGAPSARDRVLALELGTHAALELGRRLEQGRGGEPVASGMVGILDGHFSVVDLAIPATQIRRVAPTASVVAAARHLGIVFGDELVRARHEP
ncbi:MAG: 6-phosphofructokinase [Polyangiaceae bacterium]